MRTKTAGADVPIFEDAGLARIKSELFELDGLDASALRRRALEVVGKHTRSVGLLSYCARVGGDGQLSVTEAHCYGPEVVSRAFAAFRDTQSQLRPVLVHRRPRARDRSTFASTRTLVAAMSQQRPDETLYYRRVLQPHGLGDVARVLVYDGEEFAGYFGLGSADGFSARALRQLRGAVDPVSATFVAAHRLDRRADTPPADLLVRPDGRIVFASALGRQWLDANPSAAGWVQACTAAVERGTSPIAHALGCSVRWTRLHDHGLGHAYLIEIRSMPPIRLSWRALLTPREVEIAELLAVGATNREAGRALGVTAETVKVHRRRIYRKLRVSNVVELRRRVSA